MEKKIKGMDAGIEELILKQADGQLSDSEAVFLRAWIETSVDNRNLYFDDRGGTDSGLRIFI